MRFTPTPDTATVPDCPRCGLLMREQLGYRGPFWSCRNYPRCRGTREMAKLPEGAVEAARRANVEAAERRKLEAYLRCTDWSVLPLATLRKVAGVVKGEANQ